jgi:outer membrane PBP1 activator LpoA protein
MVPAPRFEPGRLIPAPALAPARERTLDAVAAFPFPSSERSHAPAQTPNPEGSSAKPLADAIRALRTEHDPGRALALLDEHRAELARGSFGHEALLVRVEALLALHREGEVLMLLDATALAEVAASRSLRLTRAELRAAAGRCVEALEDFELVLARTTDERAVRGRDACRKRLAASGDPGNIRP